MDAADTVGFIVGERGDGYYLYGCDEHTPQDMREPHRELLRDEAAENGVVCDECGLELAEAEGIG